MINRLEELNNWQLAREINKEIFKFISKKEFNKDFPLCDQINRAAGSIMDNIAEGFGRNGDKEFIQFLSFSKGSCVELKSQLYRAIDRCYIESTEFKTLYDKIDQVEKMNSKLIGYLRNSSFKGWKY